MLGKLVRMLGKLVRIGVLFTAMALAAASTTNQGRSPQYPPPQPPGYSSGGGSADLPPETVYACTEVRTARTEGSFCFATQERCDRERADAEKDGAHTTECRPMAPVACFQLGNDPNPSMEACAETADDCDLLRLIDKDKNGQTGGPCAWRHGAGQNAPGPDPTGPPGPGDQVPPGARPTRGQPTPRPPSSSSAI
jgi:hypothetical protein